MIAAHREIVALRIRIVAAFDFAHAPPVDVGRISVLLVAGHHAAFAADALRHVEVKAVLFSRLQRSRPCGRLACGSAIVYSASLLFFFGVRTKAIPSSFALSNNGNDIRGPRQLSLARTMTNGGSNRHYDHFAHRRQFPVARDEMNPHARAPSFNNSAVGHDVVSEGIGLQKIFRILASTWKENRRGVADIFAAT